MGAQADNPKAKARQRIEVDASQKDAYWAIPEEERCLRLGQLRGCSHSHRCMDCWADAGMSPMHKQADIRIAPPEWIRMELFVEDGISMIAGLVHQRAVKTNPNGFHARPLTCDNSRREVMDFENEVLLLRCGPQPKGKVNFRIGDFACVWGAHVGYGGFQNRPIKGKQWMRFVRDAMESLGA